jgi:hypothetical protein
MTESENKLAARVRAFARARRNAKLARAYKACFCGEDGKLTLEGSQVIADLREQSKLFGSASRRGGVIDKDQLLEIEGRRQVVLRLINVLELDPLGVARLMEVDDA